MEKIRLTDAEKALLKELSANPITTPIKKDDDYFAALCGLEQKKLVECRILKTSVTYAVLTPYGRSYLRANPELENPIPWDKIIAIATLAAAVAALFVGCIRLAAMGLR